MNVKQETPDTDNMSVVSESVVDGVKPLSDELPPPPKLYFKKPSIKPVGDSASNGMKTDVKAITSKKSEMTEDNTSDIDKFWESYSGKAKPTQLERYEQKKAPEGIKKFIRIGGGPKMGVTLEEFARFRFTNLKKRSKGENETGYDHRITLHGKEIFVEQKSSGHWGEDDYKWQHIEEKHKWNMLLLCGIDYTNVRFWAMDRKTFGRLISEKKITNQGNKTGESSEGMWFNYSDVKDSLVEIQTGEQLLQFASSLQVSGE